MIILKQVMTYHFTTKGPLRSKKGSPSGEREYWEMTEGLLTGEGIHARIAMPGGDWMQVGTDGYARPDVRVQLLTEDEEVILLHYTGLVQTTEKFKNAADHNSGTDWTDQYMRMAMRFDTGVEKYSWLNQHIFIAEGRLIGTNEIEYLIYQV